MSMSVLGVLGVRGRLECSRYEYECAMVVSDISISVL